MISLAQNAIVYGLPFLILVTVIVTVHELGHFLTARAFGVAVDRFSIGFGRAVASWRDRAGVEWRIGWLPLGGYVRFAGDTNAASVPDKADLEVMRTEIAGREGAGAETKYLPFKPLWQRALIVVAGPAANFLLSIVIFWVLFAAFGEVRTSTRIDQVEPGGAAEAAGFQLGDRILSANGRAIDSFQDLQFYVQFRAGVPIDFVVDRGGRDLRLIARPRPMLESSPFGGLRSVGRLGLGARGAALKRYGPAQALGMGARKTWDLTETTAFYLGRIVTGKVGADQLHSFIGIGHASGSITREAMARASQDRVNWVLEVAVVLAQVAASLSVSVGLLNLLPVPVLDGGHLLFYAYEAVVRRPLAARVQAIGYRVGLALLVGLMLFATWNDLRPLGLFHLFGG